MSKKSLEERVQRLEDIHEIQNAMSRHGYYRRPPGSHGSQEI